MSVRGIYMTMDTPGTVNDIDFIMMACPWKQPRVSDEVMQRFIKELTPDQRAEFTHLYEQNLQRTRLPVQRHHAVMQLQEGDKSE